jgi:mannan endo-1,4-beta-mannosidase
MLGNRRIALLSLLAACAEDPDVRADGGFGEDELPGGLCEEPLDAQGLVGLGDEGQFEIDGAAFVPQGLNSYPLLQHAGNGKLDLLDDIFAQALALGRPLIRTPAFMDGGGGAGRIRDADGSLREEGLAALDRVLASAAEHGARLILILTNNWKDFGGAPAVLEMVAPGEELPKNAFWSDPRAIAAQLAYQRSLATRRNTVNGRIYGDDPTIFAWELANEARCEPELTPALCDGATLASWAKTMAEGLRSAGVQQLIAWGGGGYLGEYGEDLRRIAERGAVDVLTLHLYASQVRASSGQSRAEAAVAWGEGRLRESAQAAVEAGLPLLLEEVNWKPEPGEGSDEERARVLAAWLAVARELRVGTLPWMIGERGRVDYDGYLIPPEDGPTLDVLTCTSE